MFGLRNVSHVTAKYPYLIVTELPRYRISVYGIDGNGRFGLNPRPTGTALRNFSGGADDVINPGQEQLVFGVEIECLKKGERLLVGGTESPPAMEISIQFGCENYQMQRKEIRVEADELLSLFRNS